VAVVKARAGFCKIQSEILIRVFAMSTMKIA
jgi:hypothetical protein